MTLTAAQALDLLTPEGMTRLFDAVADELLALVDLRVLDRVLRDGNPDTLAQRMAAAWRDAAGDWVPKLEPALLGLTAPLAAALVDAADRELGVDATARVRDVADVMASTTRGVRILTATGQEKFGAQLGRGALALASSGQDDLISAYLRGRVRERARLIGAAYLGRARSSGLFACLAATGVQRFEFVAVVDHRTTDICRYLHGRTLSVQSALDAIGRSARAPAGEALDHWPWCHTDGDEVIAETVEGSRVVARLDPAEPGGFLDGLNEAELEEAGLVLPPLHAYCRSTLVPA